MQRTYNISANYDLFYYEPAGNNSITISFPYYQGNYNQLSLEWSHLEYSFDGHTWYVPEYNSTLTTLNRVYIQMTYGKEYPYGTRYVRNVQYPARVTSGYYKVGGNAKTYHNFDSPLGFRNDTLLVSAKDLRGYQYNNYLPNFFEGCTALEETFDLLCEVDYQNGLETDYTEMFKNCTSLKKCPKIALSTKTKATDCPRLQSMFQGCTNLETLPELKYPYIMNGQVYSHTLYGNMFYGCTKIKLSTIQTSDYLIPYKIPSGTADPTSQVGVGLTDMFGATGGTFTGTPTWDTTYYTSNEII